MDQQVDKTSMPANDLALLRGQAGGTDFLPFETHLGSADHGLIIICDHAENTLPDAYGTLGLPAEQLARHIGYDIGAKALSQQLAGALDASLVMSRFSRLLIDPNRGQDDPTLIMRLSDGAVVPGNGNHDAAERAHRLEHFYHPYDQAILDTVAAVTQRTGKPPILFSIHSFTSVWRGQPRPWHAGVLWDKDPRLAVPLIEALRAQEGMIVGDNEPYRGELPGDTMHRHGTVRGIAHALLEVRQDLIEDDAGVARWAAILAPILQDLVLLDGLRVPLKDDDT